MFTEKQLQQIKDKGIDLKTIEKQIKHFRTGFPFLDIRKAATIGDGIVKLDNQLIEKYVKDYEHALETKQVVKFVPASGAASRMFKHLFEFSAEYSIENHEKLFANKGFNSVFNFFDKIKTFAFYNDLNKALDHQLDELIEKKEYKKILDVFLTEKGLNYGNLPKGLLKFHNYPTSARTPVEEHLVEGANYSNDKDHIVQLHFTVSPEHRKGFETHVVEVKTFYENQYKIKYQVSFSEQKSSTDTIAVDMQNEPFVDADGTLVFRPGGHGALIENLNDIYADIIFIKNIDNIVPDHLKPETYKYKKAIAGILIDYQEKVFDYLTKLETLIDDNLINEIYDFIRKELCIEVTDFEKKKKQEKIEFLKNKLNRPVRVCGMVKNEGEPGGGPFWALNADETISLQVVESSQIDLKNSEKSHIAKNATHFNPVDIVCGVKDYKGKKFDLTQFIDQETGFISIKSKDGKDLKAQELPGLWNGAMSDWNTVFVEIPIITFNPVKTINDLLRPEHQ